MLVRTPPVMMSYWGWRPRKSQVYTSVGSSTHLWALGTTTSRLCLGKFWPSTALGVSRSYLWLSLEIECTGRIWSLVEIGYWRIEMWEHWTFAVHTGVGWVLSGPMENPRSFVNLLAMRFCSHFEYRCSSWISRSRVTVDKLRGSWIHERQEWQVLQIWQFLKHSVFQGWPVWTSIAMEKSVPRANWQLRTEQETPHHCTRAVTSWHCLNSRC